MRVIYGRNVNEVYTIGINTLVDQGEIADSRNGKVVVMPMPVTTTYEKPQEKVLFNKRRDANPFFHLMEGLWMLSGRNDVEWICRYNSTFHQYSDDGKTFNAAYGYRWRQQFNRDQLVELVSMLEQDPNTRRAVVSMWDPYADFNEEGKDFPCNLNIAFRIRDHKLTMTVFNRSNDIIWGAYGANAVHMSMLQEYIAGLLDIEIGKYVQVSNDYHAYADVLAKGGVPDPHPMDPYDMGDVKPFPMFNESLHKKDRGYEFHQDLEMFMEGKLLKKQYMTEFFLNIVLPMDRAWNFYKKKDYPSAVSTITDYMPDNCDWKTVSRLWLIRRAETYATKKDRKNRIKHKVK